MSGEEREEREEVSATPKTKTGFHYVKNGHDQTWEVGTKFAKLALFDRVLYAALPKDTLCVDADRQGLNYQANEVDNLKIGAKSNGASPDQAQLIDKYRNPAIAWVKRALQKARGIEEAAVDASINEQAKAIVKLSAFSQAVNIGLGYFRLLRNTAIPSFNANISQYNQRLEFEARGEDSLCCLKRFQFELGADSQLQKCKIIVVSKGTVTHELKDTKTKQVVLAEEVEVTENVELEIDFSQENWPMKCNVIEVKVAGNSLVQSVIETAAEFVVGREPSEYMTLPVFSEKTSFFDFISQHLDTDSIQSVMQDRLSPNGKGEPGFHSELECYQSDLRKELHKLFVNKQKKERKLSAADALQRYVKRPSYLRMLELGQYADVLSKGKVNDRLNKLFRRCVDWMTSRSLEDVPAWFREEKEATLSVYTLHDRELIKDRRFPMLFNKLKDSHKSTLFAVYRGLTLLHRVASYGIQHLPLLLDQLEDENRYQVLRDRGRGNSVLNIVTYSAELDAKNKPYLKRLLQEIKKLTPEQQTEILAMLAMNRGVLHDQPLVQGCLGEINPSTAVSSTSIFSTTSTAPRDDSDLGPGIKKTT